MTTIPVAARRIEPLFPDRLEIVGWVDPVVDAVGFPPHHPYVELLWLPILGPSTTWLYRRLATSPAEHGPRHRPHRARRVASDSACDRRDSTDPTIPAPRRPVRARFRHGPLAVRTTAPPLSQRQLDRLAPRPASRSPVPHRRPDHATATPTT